MKLARARPPLPSARRRRAAASAMVVLIGLLGSCGNPSPDVLRGDPARGRRLLHDYGCGGCHVIPKVLGADGKLGPPLNDIGARVYLGGMLPNSPENMVRWIRAPQAIKPNTAMPDVHASDQDARDMVAHLSRLR